jgi:Sec-independent protein secretion pathway component TatC
MLSKTAKIKWSLFCGLVAFIPSWLYLAARFILQPAGFWQNFALAGAALWVGGSAQCFLLLALISTLYIIWRVL